MKYHLYDSHLVFNLFNDNKSKQYDTLLYLFHKLKNILNCYSKKAFISLYLLLHKHKKICSRVQCPCNEIDIAKINELKSEKSEIEEKKKILLNYFITILEHEVVFSLNKLRSGFENKSMQESLIFLHLDIITLLQENYKMAYYYAGIYASIESDKMSLIHLYFLHELKFNFLNQLLKSHIEEKKVIISYPASNDPYSIELYKKNKKLKEKHHYLITQEIIKGLMMKCIEIIAKVINYKKHEVHSKNSSAKCEDLIGLLHDYKEMSTMLLGISASFFSEYKLSQMKQLAYLVYHYYSIMNIPIPIYMSQSISSISSYSNSDIDDISFEEIKMRNPMIAQMKSNDSFEINYISQSICDILHYKKSELINSNINILLPQVFNETHQMYLKLFVLFGDNNYSKNSFIKTSQGSLIYCHLICKSMPSYSEFYLLLINIHFIPSVSPKKINYHIIIDQNFQFLYSNQEFYDHFFLNYQMVTMLNIDLANFFCLNREQIAFKKDKLNDNNELEIFEIIKAISGFNTIDSNNFLKFRNYNCFIKKLSKNRQEAIKTFSVHKASLFGQIDKIIQNVSEMNLDYEYLTRMTSLQERLRQSMAKHYHNSPSQCKYELTLNYKSLGNFDYCVVLIEEDDIYPSPLIQLIKKFKASTDSELHYNKNISIRSISKLSQNRIINVKDILTPANALMSSSLRLSRLNSSSSKREILTTYNKTNESSVNNTKQSSTLLLKSTENISSLIDQTLRKKTNFKTISANEINSSTPPTLSLNHWYNSINIINSFRIIFLMLLLLLVILNLYHLIEDTKKINTSRYISLINNNAFLIKGQLIFSALFFLKTCCVTEGIIKDDINRMRKYYDSAHSLMNLLVSIQIDINACDMNEIKELYQILITKNRLKSINYETMTIVESNSTLFDQIIYIHYYFLKLYHANDPKSCGLSIYFKKTPDKAEEEDRENKEINIEQLLLHYFLYNSYGEISKQLDKLSRKTYQILIDFHTEIKESVGIINGMILLADFICLIVFLVLIGINGKSIRHFLIYFMTNSIEDNSLDEIINILKQLINEFTSSKFKLFQASISKKEVATVSSPKKTILFANKKHSIIDKDKINQALESNKIQISKSNERLFSPRFISVGLMMIVSIYSCLLIFQAINIYINVNIYDQLLILNSINSNFIQRIPALYQLALYYFISIIFNKPDHVPLNTSSYEASLFSNFYSIDIDYNNDSFFEQLDVSYYAFLYYQIMIIRGNINQLGNDERRKSNFKIVLDYEYKLNEKNNFPLNAALGFSQITPESCLTIVECFENQNRILKLFLRPGNRMNVNGLNIVLDATIQQFNIYYLRFIKDSNGHNFKYFNEADIVDALMNVLDIFQVFDSYMNIFIRNDMNATYDKMKRMKIYFSILSIIFNILLANLTYLLVIKRIEKDKHILYGAGQDVLLIINKRNRIENSNSYQS